MSYHLGIKSGIMKLSKVIPISLTSDADILYKKGWRRMSEILLNEYDTLTERSWWRHPKSSDDFTAISALMQQSLWDREVSND